MQTSQFENICSQVFLLPVCVTTVTERCLLSLKKEKRRGNCPREWECLSLLLLKVGSRCLFGVRPVLAHAPVPPSVAAKAGWEAGRRSAGLLFFSAAGKSCSLWVPLAWCPRLPCLLLWPGSAFRLSSSNKKNAFFSLSPDQISIEEKLVTH